MVTGLLPRRGKFASALQEAVTRSLCSDGRSRTMVGPRDRHVVAERQQFASALQEAISGALCSDGRRRTMAGQDGDVVAERQQLPLDAADQLVVIAIGKIGAPDRALKQRVADQRK